MGASGVCLDLVVIAAAIGSGKGAHGASIIDANEHKNVFTQTAGPMRTKFAKEYGVD